jgi:hypothetical protein
MKDLPQLRAVSPPQRYQLLRQLYEAAEEMRTQPAYAEDVVRNSRQLIRKAAKILDGFRNDKRQKLRAYPLIIRKIFEIALGETRTDESIRQMLRRAGNKNAPPTESSHRWDRVDSASH